MATCETHGHLHGYGDVCVFCKTPMPVVETGPLSDLRLEQVRRALNATINKDANDGATAIAELQRSRALVAELRALAERMGEPVLYQRHVHHQFVDGAHSARAALLSELSSLLAAHDAQQAEGKAE